MFVGGLDVSGNPSMGNHKYLAGVLGDDKVVKSTIRQLGRGDIIHIGRFKRHDRIKILSDVNFENSKIMAFCAEINKNTILNSIRRIQSHKARRRPDNFLVSNYNRILFGYLQPKFTEYLSMHGHIRSDVVFQCDFDCHGFAKDNSLTTAPPDSAHSLADIIAYGNNHDHRPKGVIELNFAAEIDNDLRRKFRW